mmetsp:Transcript_108138/g.186672  ORF Transcript_108138/g.186672 Transcript_108138/m.186672 type:complete len:238 (+) Transcript_108138:333-1046(+)
MQKPVTPYHGWPVPGAVWQQPTTSSAPRFQLPHSLSIFLGLRLHDWLSSAVSTGVDGAVPYLDPLGACIHVKVAMLLFEGLHVDLLHLLIDITDHVHTLWVSSEPRQGMIPDHTFSLEICDLAEDGKHVFQHRLPFVRRVSSVIVDFLHPLEGWLDLWVIRDGKASEGSAAAVVVPKRAVPVPEVVELFQIPSAWRHAPDLPVRPLGICAQCRLVLWFDQHVPSFIAGVVHSLILPG